jgi:hypothetical protein
MSFQKAEEFGYDREVLQEAYECQHIEVKSHMKLLICCVEDSLTVFYLAM